jgi:hypothetical protein
MAEQLSNMRTVAFVYAPIYFLLVGVLYLWGFWSSYHVNVLEHASLSDVVKAAAQPVAWGFVAWIGGGLIGLGLRGPAATRSNSPAASNGRFRVQRPHIIIGICMLLLGIATYMTSYVYISVLLPLVAVWLAHRYIPTDVMSDMIPAEAPRIFVISLLTALPPFAFAHGLIQADLIKGGRVFQYLASPIEMVANKAEHFSDSPRLLGRVGGHLFFYLPSDGDLMIIRSDLVPAIQLRRFDAGIKGRFGKAAKPAAATPVGFSTTAPAQGAVPSTSTTD